MPKSIKETQTKLFLLIVFIISVTIAVMFKSGLFIQYMQYSGQRYEILENIGPESEAITILVPDSYNENDLIALGNEISKSNKSSKQVDLFNIWNNKAAFEADNRSCWDCPLDKHLVAQYMKYDYYVEHYRSNMPTDSKHDIIMIYLTGGRKVIDLAE